MRVQEEKKDKISFGNKNGSRRRIIKKLVAVLGTGILLLVAYMIPEAVSGIEDSHLEKESKSYEIDEISITSASTSFWEEMQEFSTLTTASIKVEQEYLSVEEKDNLEVVGTGNLTVEEAGRCVVDFIKILDQDVDVKNFSANLIVMYSSYSGNVYEVWTCNAFGTDGLEYILWLDDATGKVLAFECELDEKLDLNAAMQDMAVYYGYENSVIDETILSMDMSSEIVFVRNDREEQFPLAIAKCDGWLYFNLYLMGNTSVSSSS